jgi:hypothetical protein
MLFGNLFEENWLTDSECLYSEIDSDSDGDGTLNFFARAEFPIIY